MRVPLKPWKREDNQTAVGDFIEAREAYGCASPLRCMEMTAHGRCARGGVPLRKMARDLSRSQRAREKKSPTRAAFDRLILNNHTQLSCFVYTKKIWRRIVCVLWLDCAANCGCRKIIFFGRIAKKTGATCNGNVCHQNSECRPP